MRAVSIGTNCQAAAQIKRVFNGSSSGFFDALFVKPDAIVWLIENDFALPIDETCLDYRVRDVPVIEHKHHPIRWIHDFSMKTPDAYRADIFKVRAKYAYLAQKWRSLIAEPEPTLFVCADCDLRAFDAVARALADRRGELPYHALVTRSEHRAGPYDHSQEPADPRVTKVIIKQDLTGGPDAWSGLPAEWDRAFAAAFEHARAESKNANIWAGFGARTPSEPSR